MLKGILYFILIIVFVIGILANEYHHGRLPKTTETAVAGVILGIFILSLMVFLLYENARSVSLFKHAMFVPAEITIKRFSGAHRTPHFEYKYSVDSIEFIGSWSLPPSGLHKDVGDTFYVAVDSTHPSRSIPLMLNDELLTDKTWATRQLNIERKDKVLFLKE